MAEYPYTLPGGHEMKNETTTEKRFLESQRIIRNLDEAKSELTTRAIIVANDAACGATDDRLHTRHVENYVAARKRYDAAYAVLKTLIDKHEAGTK